MDTISQWYRRLAEMLRVNPALTTYYNENDWLKHCKKFAYPKWDNRDQITILESKIKSLEEELEYYKTPYHIRLLNKIKPLLNIRFKIVMYSKD